MPSLNYVACFKQLVNLHQQKKMDIEEMVTIFLYAIFHHVKNRVLKREFISSGETVNRQFRVALRSILKVHRVLLKSQIQYLCQKNDEKWIWFKLKIFCYGN